MKRANVARTLFSVMQPRDDLPRMPGGMAAVFIVSASLCAAAAARLGSPEPGSAVLASQNVAGLLASLPLLPLSVTLYALVILLWRRIASLLTSPLSFGLMMLFGARFSDACTLTLALLPLSYAFAVSLIGRESRFRRMTTLSLFAAGSFLLAGIARIGADFGSFPAFRDAFLSEIPVMLSEILTRTAPDAELILATGSLNDAARSMFIMLPTAFGVFCVVFAWISERLMCRLFLWFDCSSSFVRVGEGVTLPFSYAAAYALVFLTTILTPAEQLPMVHAMFLSVLLIMALPCAAVGVRKIAERVSENLFYITREKLFTGMMLFLAFAILGAFPFLLITSAVGAVSVLRRRISKKTDSDS